MPHFALELSEFADANGAACVSLHLECADDLLLEWPWRQGVTFSRPPPTPIVLVERAAPDGVETVFHDYLSSPLPLVSSRLRQALEAAGVSNIDYYPVQVEGLEGSEGFPGYWAANVIGRVATADAGNSVSIRAMGMPGADLFERFAPRADLETDLRMFRMLEHMSTLVVDQAVVDACEAAGVDTLDFTPIEDWRR